MSVKILFVCLGNICRSPMAEGLMAEKIEKRGLAHLKVDSSGTSAYHLGELPDERMRQTARQRGIELTSRARQFAEDDFEAFDYIIAMDKHNKQNILKLAEKESHRDKVYLMRDFDEQAPGADVPDPYFGGQRGFDEVYEILDRSTEKLLEMILKDT